MGKIVQFSGPPQGDMTDARYRESDYRPAIHVELDDASTVVRLKPRDTGSRSASTRRHPRHLLQDVYTAGSLSVRADDLPTKLLAVTLNSLSFLVIEEIQPDGTARRIGTRMNRSACDPRPWRLLRPAFGRPQGAPDAVGTATHLMPAPQ